ncbi:BEM_HP_G0078950.mRNA.1.CDS.1 [Saccharomyces cerevisiae]|nr:BEM_HP_G0078950.mRNA.1.CDS.1 [Saccharomyces cerevisiae]CAI6990913.1 BEM_HP_G0078950.mRNA.1.CDS.1 [Saccharomyces cerevisiae]
MALIQIYLAPQITPNSTAITADLGSSEAENLLQLKTGLAAIVSTVIEEFTLFMDIVEENRRVTSKKRKTLGIIGAYE